MIDIKAIRAAAEAAEARNWAHGANPATVLTLCDEIERLRTKLEVTDKTRYDGIDCRDKTILMQDEEIERLRKEPDDWRRRYKIERMGLEQTIVGGRYPDGTPAW